MNPLDGLHVAVIDDDDEFRDSLLDLLEKAGASVFGASDGADFLDRIEKCDPHAVLVDLKLRGNATGQGLTSEILDQRPYMAIICMSGFNDVDAAVSSVKRGAIDFLSKPLEPAELLQAISNAAERRDRLKSQYDRLAVLEARFDRLTTTETEILQKLESGLSMKEIAFARSVTPQAIDKAKKKLLEKLESENVVCALCDLHERDRLRDLFP